MRIAILAWGSLIWDPKGLQTTNGFEPTGPTIPIEFGRISGKDNKPRRLTLVIDETAGTPCVTYVAISAFDTLTEAKGNLRDREGMPGIMGIGFIDPQSGDTSVRALKRHPRVVDTIRSWLITSDYDAVIWTALANNFVEEAGEPFSAEAALRFLDRQPENQLGVALEYISKAPQEVQTPVRTAIAKRWPEEHQ